MLLGIFPKETLAKTARQASRISSPEGLPVACVENYRELSNLELKCSDQCRIVYGGIHVAQSSGATEPPEPQDSGSADGSWNMAWLRLIR
jgi:hypothetical protein